jgi:hypothetical protein
LEVESGTGDRLGEEQEDMDDRDKEEEENAESR